MINESIWTSLISNPNILRSTPTWVHPIFAMSFAAIERLPKSIDDIDPMKLPCFSKPRGGAAEITANYLEFLKREIELRGSKSKQVADTYTGRLNALSKHEGKMMYEMFIFGSLDPGRIRSCMIFFLPENCEIVWVE